MIADGTTAGMILAPNVVAALILGAVIADKGFNSGLDVKGVFGPAIGSGKTLKAVRIGHDEISFLGIDEARAGRSGAGCFDQS